jgi:HAD superfamily hydrolase (TIGR01509 family)
VNVKCELASQTQLSLPSDATARLHTPSKMTRKMLAAVMFLIAPLAVSSFAVFTKRDVAPYTCFRPSSFYAKKEHFQTRSSLSATNTDGSGTYDYALIFDCDGVIIETEELHRLAYNAAFEEAGLEIDGDTVEWSVQYYDILQNTVGGGKGKMNYHFRTTMDGIWPRSQKGTREPPGTDRERSNLIDALQENKTNLYKKMIGERAKPRPGVVELMDEAIADPSIAVGVCSASTKSAVTKVLDTVLGPERRGKLDVCILGDDVAKLKPDPLIYVTAAERLNIDPSRCVVVEDSIVGLKAAKGAGMKCIITYTSSTENEDFYGQGADAKIPDIASRQVNLGDIFGPLRQDGVNAKILTEKKD